MIVTLDGPAGSGKSSTAKEVARRLGFRHLDSGAFYRALTLAALRQGIAVEDWDTLSRERLDSLGIAARPGPDGYQIFIRDDDVSFAIRGPEVTAHVSRMARVPAVRGWLLGRLRDAATTDLVADGRDMGTVVFPDAGVKVFLTAELDTRARRRLLERGVDDPDTATLAAESRRLLERDRTDSRRSVAPLRRAADAVVIDTTALTFEEQVDHVIALVRRQLTDSGT